MTKKIIMLTLFCVCIMLTGCDNQTEKNDVDVVEVKPITITTVRDDVKQEQFAYVDIDFIDEEYLMKIAQYKGGSLEDRIYTILVTLNKSQENEASETYSEYSISIIQDTVLRELYQVCGLTPYDFEGIVPDEITKEAMQIIKCEKSGIEYKD